MVQSIWLEVMISQEEELSIVMKEPGTLCVPVTGKTMERMHELFVVPLDITLVNYRFTCSLKL